MKRSFRRAKQGGSADRKWDVRLVKAMVSVPNTTLFSRVHKTHVLAVGWRDSELDNEFNSLPLCLRARRYR